MSSTQAPYRAGAPMPPEVFETIRRRSLLEGCKWDAQVGDIATLASFPLVLDAATARQLAMWAEALSAEAFAAEEEILHRPDLLPLLGLPTPLRHALSASGPLTPAAVRTIRFDFHFTTDGWRISEANSDVPGGFTEASHFAALVAAQYPTCHIIGNPGETWAQAMAQRIGDGGHVALLSAPGLMEDLQVVSFLARQLVAGGIAGQIVTPGQIIWRDRRAYLHGHAAPLAAIVRFFQGEWLVDWSDNSGWEYFFRDGLTPIAHPGLAMITESKRFPLLWPHLTTALPTWKLLLPESSDPRDVPWMDDDGWLVKRAFSNTGDFVIMRSTSNRTNWSATCKAVRREPESWVAQRRFIALPLTTPLGDLFPCIGVYTIDGRAAGIYARLSRSPVVDFRAIDIAALIEDEQRS
ncbi:MAG: glutathionylspermidine synthase family protein [Chthoniobacter sp.]